MRTGLCIFHARVALAFDDNQQQPFSNVTPLFKELSRFCRHANCESLSLNLVGLFSFAKGCVKHEVRYELYAHRKECGAAREILRGQYTARARGSSTDVIWDSTGMRKQDNDWADQVMQKLLCWY